jgi:hypothetical protein
VSEGSRSGGPQDAGSALQDGRRADVQGGRTGDGSAGPNVETCAQAGCTTGFTCASCPNSLVCDDLHGPARCVTVETLAGCAPGTEFCNSSCGVCVVPGSACGIDTCDSTVRSCDGGAGCGRGTHCTAGGCVPD